MQIVRQNQKDGDTTNGVELWDVLLHRRLWKQTLEELLSSVIHLWLILISRNGQARTPQRHRVRRLRRPGGLAEG